MNYNFSDRVRRALAMAREAAMKLGHPYVGTEHMLLGLLQDEGGVARRVLHALDVQPGAIRERVLAEVRPGKERLGRAELPYTSRGKKVLELSMAEARDLGDAYVGTEHLLLGLLREEKGIAAQVLGSVGVTAEKARDCLRQERGARRFGVAEGRDAGAARTGGRIRGRRDRPSADDVWFLEVDPSADAPIYEQIIARIEEAVATGRLETGERLPPIRQLAEELGIAPGTVARAYSELEGRGVLETEGSRGTRVASRPSSAVAGEDRADTLEGLLRPVVVAAYHMGATAEQLRKAVERAMKGIFGLLA